MTGNTMNTLLLLLLLQPTDTGKALPPPGITISDADRAELTKAVAEFEQEIKDVRRELQGQPILLDLLPDVLIYHKAVDWALKYDEFYDVREVKTARSLLHTGRERLAQIKANKPEYLQQTGLVVRGYVSKIDGSVQPYGLVVPVSYTPKTLNNYRLDVWLHGRGDKLTELAFIDQRQRQPGEFTPRDAFVLHPYGRYCNAYKFAGEVDVFEAMEHCKKHYRIDDKRLVVRGFSMGGAACWHLAVHHPGTWCAAAPGAGFAETPEYTNIAKDPEPPTWWEQKLWHLYNATDYAENLKSLPTIAYSGEIDKQKQAADVMAREMDKFGLKLRHIIGPKMGHKYDAESKKEIEKRLNEAISLNHRSPIVGEKTQATTWTTRYHRFGGITIQGLDEHWAAAKLDLHKRAWLTSSSGSGISYTIATSNISAFTLNDREKPLGLRTKEDIKRTATVDNQAEIPLPSVQSDQGFTAHFRKENGQWKVVDTLDDGKLRKKPGLQGPIDDAFMDSFLIVKPSGASHSAIVNAWVDAEMKRAIDQWRKLFRGEPRVKFDKDVTEADIANCNLILWGHADSNSMIRKLDRFPVRWLNGKLITDHQSYSAMTHVPILIYPNPLNPARYVVLNSGFTFREQSNRTNARQVPSLPDWAFVDITTPPNSKWPGKVVDAGFFGEMWEWKK